MRFISLTLLLAFAVVSPSAAQGPKGPNLLRSPSAPIGKPFARLFGPDAKAGMPGVTAPPVALSIPPGAAQRPSARVVCGMTMVPVDSSLDPKIEHPVPSNGRKFTLKTVKPPMCGQ